MMLTREDEGWAAAYQSYSYYEYDTYEPLLIDKSESDKLNQVNPVCQLGTITTLVMQLPIAIALRIFLGYLSCVRNQVF